MKIYSDTLTADDIYRTLRETFAGHDYAFGGFPSIDEFRELANPRKRMTGSEVPYARAFELFVEWLGGGQGTSHPRRRNGREGYALTWAEYGQWFARLFDIDPDAWISGWDGVQKFHEGTHRQFASYSRKLGGGAFDVPTAVEARLYHACPTRSFRRALGDPYRYNGPHA